MNSNEAPEKIYVTECMLFATNPEITLPQNDKIEYTRTDVFFKKLEEWLDEYISDMVEVDTRILVGSFKNYMEGKL